MKSILVFNTVLYIFFYEKRSDAFVVSPRLPSTVISTTASHSNKLSIHHLSHKFRMPILDLSTNPSSHSDSTSARIKSKEERFYDGKTRQLLGLKNPSTDTVEKWKIRLQLTKPISWIPLSLIVMCGAAATGNYHWIWNPFDPNDRDVMLGMNDALKGLVTMILAGPFSEGFAQTINDWYDKDIDAINEPYRPIPSGALSQSDIFAQLRFLLFGGIALALGLDFWTGHASYSVTAIALLGYLISYIYSAPPLKLKQNGWLGDLAIGICYISFPWWCGMAVFGDTYREVDWFLPLVLSITGVGTAIMNDFKSVEGDKKFGLNSIPLMYGFDRAIFIVMATQTLPQIGIAWYLNSIGETSYSLALLSLLLPQLYFQKTLLLEDPLENDLKYVASTSPFIFLGVMVSALCIGNHNWI